MKPNILFITLVQIESIFEKGIYTDLIRKFNDEGHNVYVVCPIERKYKKDTYLIKEGNTQILNVRTLNIQKTNIVEKGIATITLAYFFSRAIAKHFKAIQADIILYSTPPITLTGLISSLKKNYKAYTYLLLKDIFPQNAVDMGMMSSAGIIYKYFRKKEKELYMVSDRIGCMSQRNVEYLIKHNTYLDAKKIEVNPNSIALSLNVDTPVQRIKETYNIPKNAVVFLYGGNLGRPQGIDFLLEVLKSNLSNTKAYFLIVGDGTEYSKISNWVALSKPQNVKLIKYLPKEKYDHIVRTADVGMIFLDFKFTIPNFPSRLLSYLETKVPVLLATDTNTDIGEIATENHFGLWSPSNDLTTFNKNLEQLISDPNQRAAMGTNGYEYLKKHYLVERSYVQILSKFNV